MSRAGGRKEVAGLAWPLAVGMISFTLMGVVDTLLMGRVGTAAQAGVGLATTLAFAAISFFRGVVTGAQSVVSAADGARDSGRLRRAGGAGVLLGLVTGLLSAVVLLVLARYALPALVGAGSDAPAIAGSARRYLEVRVLALPMSLAAFGFLAALQGVGDTRARMWVSLAGNVLNGALDLVLIFGLGPVPAMGEAGAAWATVASATLMSGLYCWRYVRRIGWPDLRPGWAVVRDAVHLGLPTGTQHVLEMGAFTVMTVAMARVGAAHLAASQICLQVASVSFLPGYGISEAGAVLVGRYLGARRPGAATRALRSARALALGLMTALGVVFVLAGRFLAGLFTLDPAVAELTAELLLFVAAFQVFDAMAMVHLCSLRSAGDTRWSLIVTTGAAWLITVPASLGLGLGLGWGAHGAWLGLTLEIAVLAVLTGLRVRGIRTGRVGRPDLLLGRSSAAAAAATERSVAAEAATATQVA